MTKLTIHPVGGERIEVKFNPNSYSIRKQLTWTMRDSGERKRDAPMLEFGGGQSRELDLELFFDSTEEDEPNRDVRLQTDKIVRLTRIQIPAAKDSPAQGPAVENPRPPVCDVEWGAAAGREDFPFRGVVSSLVQRFTMFDSSGTPLRAVLDVTFTELLSDQQKPSSSEAQSATRQIRTGDSLASVAQREYGDPTEWRPIALANGIENPLDLFVGANLTVPKR